MKRQLSALFIAMIIVASSCTVLAAMTTAPVVAATATTFSIATSMATPQVNQQFTISGTLKAGTTALANKPVHLESHKQNSDGTWTAWGNLADTYKRTDSVGKVSSARTLSTTGAREYRWHYNGTTTYAAARSSPVAVTVKLKTTLTPGGAVTFSGLVGKPITLYGQLWDQNGNAISGAKITWYHWNVLAQKWLADVSPSYTDAHGEYHKDYLSNTAGVSQYKVSYAGDGTHLGTTCAGSFTVYYQATSSLTITNSNWNHFSGKLTAGGQAVNGATVTLWRYNSDHRGLVKVGTATTDSTGTYSLDDTTLRDHGYYWYYASYDGSSIYTKAKSPEIEVQI